MLDVVGGALTATPAFSIHGLCNPVTCNVGLHTGASPKPALADQTCNPILFISPVKSVSEIAYLSNNETSS